MMRIRLPSTAATAVLTIALAATAVLAQSVAPTPTRPDAGSAPAPPVEIGRPQRTHGGWRSSRIVGAIVHNDRDERIGTVDDLVVGRDGRISEAVLSVGGFLGIGAKLVAVPYDRLNMAANSNGRWTLAGATKESLGSLPTFTYEGQAERRG